MAFNYKSEYERYRRYYTAIEEMSSKPKNRLYAPTVFTFLVISLFGWYAIRPTIQTILYLKREISDKTELNKKMEDKITALIEAQASYSNVQNQLSLIPEAMPKTTSIISLVTQLKNLTSESGASLSAIQVPKIPLDAQTDMAIGPTPGALNSTKPKPKTIMPKTDTKLADFPLSLVITGPYQSIQTFLKGILQMRRIITVDTMTLSAAKEDNGDKLGRRNVRLVLKVKSYYTPQ